MGALDHSDKETFMTRVTAELVGWTRFERPPDCRLSPWEISFA